MPALLTISIEIEDINGNIQIKATTKANENAISFLRPNKSNVYPTPIEIMTETKVA